MLLWKSVNSGEVGVKNLVENNIGTNLLLIYSTLVGVKPSCHEVKQSRQGFGGLIVWRWKAIYFYIPQYNVYVGRRTGREGGKQAGRVSSHRIAV